jgi:hypothetical protein
MTTDTEHADIPTRSDAARTAAWSTFGEAIHAIHATTGTDRLRRYATPASPPVTPTAKYAHGPTTMIDSQTCAVCGLPVAVTAAGTVRSDAGLFAHDICVMRWADTVRQADDDAG